MLHYFLCIICKQNIGAVGVGDNLQLVSIGLLIRFMPDALYIYPRVFLVE